MYLLQIFENDEIIDLAVFESLEQGREFISQVPGYEKLEEDGFIEEYIDVSQLPDYLEIEFNGHIIPFTKWMFDEDEKVEIEWSEVPNLSVQGNGLVEGATIVDAYSIDNSELEDYIQEREDAFLTAKSYLEEKGYEVVRDFRGSEDGEAILYRKAPEEEWHFLSHLDPSFFEDQDVIQNIEEYLED